MLSVPLLVLRVGSQSATLYRISPSARTLAPPASANMAELAAMLSLTFVVLAPEVASSLIVKLSVGPVSTFENGILSVKLQANAASKRVTRAMDRFLFKFLSPSK
jgi:hypothetical protein